MWIVWCHRCRRNLCTIGSFICLWCMDNPSGSPSGGDGQ